MMQVVCDRCKRPYRPTMVWHEPPGPEVTTGGKFERVALIFEIRKRKECASFEYVDLCPDCERALLEWMGSYNGDCGGKEQKA